MRCELVQRLTIFKADRPMNHELVSSNHCLSCDKIWGAITSGEKKVAKNDISVWGFHTFKSIKNMTFSREC